MSFIVAIDGPAGTGKGTMASRLSKKYNLVNIDTGATYRCVTLEMMNQNIGMDEEEKIAEMLKSIQIELSTEKGKQKVFLNGQDVTDKIRSKEVSANVSPVSSIKQVRLAMGGLQRKMAQGKDVIMEGRDIGTVIFPNADVKIYLDANVEVRAKRRVKQNEEKGIEMSYEEVLENIPKDLFDKYTIVRSAPFFLEFLNKNANKGTALEALCNTINIPLSKSIAVGDEENDQHMIKMAGLGVAMGNARDSIKEIANYVTCSNNEHGVAKVIDKFILAR